MSNHENHIEMIDAYLTGRLNPEDTARLMESLEQDPALKEEFLLQKDLIHSLQNKRRMDLKARLDNIEVGTGYSLPSAVSFKMIAGAALVVLLGTGAYFAYEQFSEKSEEAPAKDLAIETTPKSTESISGLTETNSSETFEAEPKEVEESETPIVALEKETSEAKKEISTPELFSPEAKKDAATKETPVVAEPAAEIAATNEKEISTDKPSTPATTAEVVKPEVITFFDEQDPSGSIPEAEVPEDKLKNARKFDTQNIEVTTRTDRRYPFHYMFYDNQLSIYGDFSKVPYEVLEVNTGTRTTYFLYHNGKYYELNPNQQKITRLKELTNERLIQELESTRTEKLQQ